MEKINQLLKIALFVQVVLYITGYSFNFLEKFIIPILCYIKLRKEEENMNGANIVGENMIAAHGENEDEHLENGHGENEDEHLENGHGENDDEHLENEHGQNDNEHKENEHGQNADEINSPEPNADEEIINNLPGENMDEEINIPQQNMNANNFQNNIGMHDEQALFPEHNLAGNNSNEETNVLEKYKIN